MDSTGGQKHVDKKWPFSGVTNYQLWQFGGRVLEIEAWSVGVVEPQTPRPKATPLLTFSFFLNLSHHNLKQSKAQSACAESTHKGVILRSKDVTQTQQQRPELPTETLTLSLIHI